MSRTVKAEDDIILETRALTKDFDGLRAVNLVDLQVTSGTIHSIIGPNGAGKTTLFNCLTGFERPTGGQVLFKQKDITLFPTYRISHLGITRSFQITSLFTGLSVLENVRIALQSREKVNFNFISSIRGFARLEERAREILHLVGLSEFESELASNLDYGSKRCLEIAIALGTEPTLLLLDEPTSGMDTEESARIIELIQKIAVDKTIMLVEHNIDAVLQISDAITVLRQGEVIARGTSSEIQKNELVQEAYLGGYHPPARS
jgi:branched-chain amino acid transport system ATP-binding protein